MQVETAARGLAELGNPTRLRIGEKPLAVGEIQSELGIPASTLSHHISRLVWAGLVEQERQGRVLRCRPRFAALRALVDFLYQECCQAGAVSLRRSPAKRQRRSS
jgi:DNA-binding transcriptional ArsR family regulator